MWPWGQFGKNNAKNVKIPSSARLRFERMACSKWCSSKVGQISTTHVDQVRLPFFTNLKDSMAESGEDIVWIRQNHAGLKKKPLRLYSCAFALSRKKLSAVEKANWDSRVILCHLLESTTSIMMTATRKPQIRASNPCSAY